jgi:outer membrane receptor protein involved in Fe transport
VCAASVSAQEATITGRITDAATGLPVDHAVVTLIETGWKTTTDISGRFTIVHLLPGRYTMRVRHLAYAATERTCAPGTSIPDTVSVALQPAILRSEEIIVESTRIGEFLKDSPYPIAIAFHDDLVRAPVVTIAEALEAIPGLATVRDGSWETAIAIRGLSRSDVVTCIDEARIETSNDIAGALSLVNMHDLERVEVMKSAASSQHGSGAIGGVIIMKSRRPGFTDQFQTSGELTNDFTSVDGGAAQYLALEASSQRYALRLSGGHRKAGNTMTPDGVLPNSQYRDFSLQGMLAVSTVGGQSALLTYQRVQADDTGIPGGTPFAATATATYTLARRELYGLEYRIPNVAGWLPLFTIRAARQQISRNVEVIQNPTTTVTPHAVHTTTSVQMEAGCALLPDVLTSAGGEIWSRLLDSQRERRNAVSGQILGERPVPLSRYTSAGLFVHNEWEAIPGFLTATCGARYDWIRISNDQALSPEYVLLNGVMQTNPAGQRLLWAPREGDDASWSANGGVRCTVTDGLDLSVLYSAAFRSPSLEERYEFIDLGSVVYVGNPDLHAERSSCFDTGVHVRTGSGTVGIDGFANFLANMVSEMPGTYEGRKAYYRSNIGTARLYGCEAEIEHSFSPWSTVNASVAFVRGEDTYAHTNLPQIPPINGQLSLTGRIAGIGAVTIASLWCGTQNDTGIDEPRTPGHAVLNLGFAGLPWQIGVSAISVRAEVRNCFDKAYRTHLTTLRGMLKDEPGRNIMLSATLSF